MTIVRLGAGHSIRNPPELHVSTSRLRTVTFVVVYIVAFNWLYINVLTELYAYYGLTYQRPPLRTLCLLYLLATMPALWMPDRFHRPSQILYWVLYLIVIIPSTFVPNYALLSPRGDALLLSVVLLGSFAALGGIYHLPLIKIESRATSPRHFWPLLLYVSVACYAVLFWTFRSSFHLVALTSVDTQRELYGVAAETSLARYALFWQAFAINPFLMAAGVTQRRMSLCLAGGLGQLFLYGLGAHKAVLLSILCVLLFSHVARHEARRCGSTLTRLLSSSIVLTVLVHETGWHIFWPKFVVGMAMRSIALPGLLTAQYHDYFSSHPITYLSHVKGFSLLHAYPYDRVPGLIIGSQYSSNITLNNNAHFWAADGLTGFGVFGILAITFVAAALFLLIDSVAQGHTLALGVLALSGHAVSVTNTSIFTMAFGGGLWLSLAILYFAGTASCSRMPTGVSLGQGGRRSDHSSSRTLN